MDAKFFNSLNEGDFGNGFHLCQGLLEGDFWPRRLGCYNVYRGRDHVDNIDTENIVATASQKGVFALGDYLTHEADTNYYYAVRSASGSGKEEQGTTAVVLLSLDEAGDQRLARPNCVTGLVATAAAEGKTQLGWWYWPLKQQVEPTHFAVFGNGGSGDVDFGVELTQVTYTGGYFYSYLTGSGTDGEMFRFAVRAVSEAGNDDGNLAWVACGVDLSGPDTIEGLIGQGSL